MITVILKNLFFLVIKTVQFFCQGFWGEEGRSDRYVRKYSPLYMRKYG